MEAVQMKTTTFLMGLILAVAPVRAQMTKWSAQYSGVTSVEVTGSTHGIGSPYIGVVCIDSNGNRLDLDQVSWTVDPTTYEVDLTFTNSFTGIVKLSGPWPSSDTNNATDFLVSVGQSNSSQLNVCGQCATFTARRTYNGDVNVADGGVSLVVNNSGFDPTTVYAYIVENLIHYGANTPNCPPVSGSFSIVGNAILDCNVTAMPAGVTPLGSATFAGGVFSSVTDLRPW